MFSVCFLDTDGSCKLRIFADFFSVLRFVLLIVMSSELSQRLSKLKGRENYDTWKIASKSYLVIKDLWSCIENEPDPEQPDTLAKDLKAWSELSLLIHENLYSYIAGTTTAHAAWKKLESSFEDRGLCRKVELLKQLVQMWRIGTHGERLREDRSEIERERRSEVQSELCARYMQYWFLKCLTVNLLFFRKDF